MSSSREFSDSKKKGVSMAKDTATKKRFVELRSRGLSFSKCSTELGVCRSSLIEWSKELEDEIINLRQMEVESLQEEFLFTHTKRIEVIGEFYKKIKTELDSRDLKEVPTDKLFVIFIKCLEVLKSEVPELVFRGKVPSFDLDFGTRTEKWGG